MTTGARHRRHLALGGLLVLLLVGSVPAAAGPDRAWRPVEAALELQGLELGTLGLRIALDAPGLFDGTPRWPGVLIEQQKDRFPLITPGYVTGTPAEAGSDLGCLALLSAEGVPYDLAAPTEGIATPVTVPDDRIGGVTYEYYYRGRKPRVVDCRLALALARAAPVLRSNGVTEVIFASHYRPSFGALPRGKYHFHAQGLAMDVKGFRVGRGVLLDVARDYERGLGFQEPSSCLGRPLTPKGMLLRRIVCDLDAADVFEAILTPDYDDVHWHHFHFSAFHPAQRSLVRPRGTALLEVPITELPAWALTRSLRQEPSRRRWDAVAATPWPADYERVREAFGIAAAPTAAADAAALLEGTGPLTRVMDVVTGVVQHIPDDWMELLRLATAER